jgi:hypothetical protein
LRRGSRGPCSGSYSQDRSEAEAKALSIVDEVAKRCDLKHAAYDAGEKAKLYNHPFIKQVILKQQHIPLVPLKQTADTPKSITN